MLDNIEWERLNLRLSSAKVLDQDSKIVEHSQTVRWGDSSSTQGRASSDTRTGFMGSSDRTQMYVTRQLDQSPFHYNPGTLLKT